MPPAVAADFAEKGIADHRKRISSKAHEHYADVQKRNQIVIGSDCQHYVAKNLQLAPITDRNRVVTIMTFRPIWSARIDRMTRPTTDPTNYADTIEFLI